MKKISIIIPMYNEQEVISVLFDRLNNLLTNYPIYEWEIVMINDGSQDNTTLLALQMHYKDSRFHLINLSRNFGKETAMLAGFDYAKGDCVVIMDADLQHPPELIPEMIKKWEEGYDDVYGKRKSRGKESFIRKKLSLLYYKLLQKSTNIPILENVGDFRLLDRSCINALQKIRETNRYTKGLYCYIGFKKTSIDFETADRVAGTSKWNLLKLFSLAIEGITSYTILPLRLATLLGFSISILAFLYILFIVIKTLTYGEPVLGYPTLMVVLLLLGGVILLTIGILGEYIGRIFIETKNRPNYFIKDIDGAKYRKNEIL